MNKEREEIANYYLQEIQNDNINLPKIQPKSSCVWHQFVISSKRRDELKEFLNEKNIETLIHYPLPFYLNKAYSFLKYK